MQVFISWSGPRSRAIATALRSWLPRVIQSLRPWMSDSDIAAGSRWFYEVSDKLEACRIGLICVTPENQASPWLHFEAGALSKAVDISNICPIGFELSPGQISGPLSQFQSVELDEEGMLKVVSSLNKACAEQALPESELIEIYEVW